MNDKFRAAIVGFLQSMFPVLVLFDLVHVTDVQVAAVMLAVNNGLTMIMFVWKTGQGVDPAGTKAAAEGAAVAAAAAADSAVPTNPDEPSLADVAASLDSLTEQLARRRVVTDEDLR